MKEYKWINIAKALAIFAVVVDHAVGYLYTDPVIQRLSFFSVSLFLMISGMTSYFANIKYGCDGPWYHVWFRSSKKLLIAYLVSTAIIQIYQTHYFDLTVYLQHIIKFDIAPPYYFVPIYFQLMLVNSVLFRYLETPVSEKLYIYRIAVMGVVITAISYFCLEYTNTFPSLNVSENYNILGGSYLLVYYIGMLLAKHKVIEKIGVIKNRIVLPILVLLCVIWYVESSNLFPISYRFLFGSSYNPPNMAQILFSIVMLVICIKIYQFGSRYRVSNCILDRVQYIGKKSLFIFLYHLTIIQICSTYIPLESMWIRRIVCFACIIIGSLLLEKIFFYLSKIVATDEVSIKKYFTKVSAVLCCACLIFLIPASYRTFLMKKGAIFEENFMYTVEPKEVVWSCDQIQIPNSFGEIAVGVLPEDSTRIIQSNTMYEISFDVSCTISPEDFYMDMYGTNYDPTELNFFFDIVPGKNHYSVIFDAGYVPEDAILRWVAMTNEIYTLENVTVSVAEKQYKPVLDMLSDIFSG